MNNSARHRKLDQLERQLNETSPDFAAEFAQVMADIAVFTTEALDRGDHTQVQADLTAMQEILGIFHAHEQTATDADVALFLAQFHPDADRHEALTAGFRSVLDRRPNHVVGDHARRP